MVLSRDIKPVLRTWLYSFPEYIIWLETTVDRLQFRYKFRCVPSLYLDKRPTVHTKVPNSLLNARRIFSQVWDNLPTEEVLYYSSIIFRTWSFERRTASSPGRPATWHVARSVMAREARHLSGWLQRAPKLAWLWRDNEHGVHLDTHKLGFNEWNVLVFEGVKIERTRRMAALAMGAKQ